MTQIDSTLKDTLEGSAQFGANVYLTIAVLIFVGLMVCGMIFFALKVIPTLLSSLNQISADHKATVTGLTESYEEESRLQRQHDSERTLKLYEQIQRLNDAITDLAMIIKGNNGK